jgi:N-methylhydantoinase B
MTRIDPITLEVIEASFVNIVREMRATLIRTSFSPILYEVHDFSCALLNPEGRENLSGCRRTSPFTSSPHVSM